MKQSNIFLTIVLIIGAFVLSPLETKAANLDVNCVNEGPCNVTPSSTPLFDVSDLKPGETIARTIGVTNSDGNDICNLNLIAQEGERQSFLSSYLFTNIRQSSTNFFGDNAAGEATNDKNLSNLFGAGFVSLGSVAPGESKTFDWLVTFDSTANNQTQNTSTVFDFSISFDCSGASPTPTLSPAGPPINPNEGTPFFQSVLGAFTSIFARDNISSPTFTPSPTTLPEGETATATSAGEVLGEVSCDKPNLWWFPLVIQFLATGIYYIIYTRRKHGNFWWTLPVIFAVISQIVHEILGCACVESKLCPWYWAFNLLILLLISLSYYLFGINDKKSSKN